jgi:hypothetical protein
MAMSTDRDSEEESPGTADLTADEILAEEFAAYRAEGRSAYWPQGAELGGAAAEQSAEPTGERGLAPERRRPPDSGDDDFFVRSR